MSDADIAVGAVVREVQNKLDNFQNSFQSSRNLTNNARPTCNFFAHRASPLFPASYLRPIRIEPPTENVISRMCHVIRRKVRHAPIEQHTDPIARSTPADATIDCDYPRETQDLR